MCLFLPVVLGIMAHSRFRQRVFYQNGQYLVSVRYGRWHNMRDFVQPDNPDVVAIYSQIGPDAWNCLDWVCRNISYRRDVGELWQFPSETICRGVGDCEDSSILICSLLRNFADAYVVLGAYQGLGHSWVISGRGETLEATFTEAQPVPDPENYCAYVYFNDQEVIELWPGALNEIFELGRDEVTKLNLMTQALEAV